MFVLRDEFELIELNLLVRCCCDVAGLQKCKSRLRVLVPYILMRFVPELEGRCTSG